MRIAWTTDPHFDHADVDAWQSWFESNAAVRGDAILITGDLSEGDDVGLQLLRLANSFELPIYFVLGNHDFYRRSIAETRQQLISLCRQKERLFYLTDCGPIKLKGNVYIVGDDGWGDATVGNYEQSPIKLRDFENINDFRLTDPADWKSRLQREGEESAERLRIKLEAIPVDAQQVLIATHIPPFSEACWYEGRTTDEFWAPFFVCGSIGKMLREFCPTRPDCKWTVLCGHTHHHGIANISDNLTVHTGGSIYGKPQMEAVIEVDTAELKVRSLR
ncbi:Calcineurin-like phosphoesterase [Novipirellula aureliae]|uniref:Calcineurin-like phosphoesterase n=1 Tax=Novipirellula aureliae TaxID=2527966 RepID=A0A5C6EA40_9BACT|nr:metallophosphoesterase [Novipirellula aureliae]TWU45395.1 Calcineurin-like phosphoesterase [Novipirellula aureliae]